MSAPTDLPHREPILRAELDDAHQTDGPSWELVLPVNKPIADEVAQIREDLFDRYIGRTPDLLVDLLGVIEAAYLTGLAQEQIPVELTDDDGGSVIISGSAGGDEAHASSDALPDPGDLAEPSDDEPVIAGDEQFFQLLGEREEETKALFAAWADERAAEYQEARDAWWSARHEELRREAGDKTGSDTA